MHVPSIITTLEIEYWAKWPWHLSTQGLPPTGKDKSLWKSCISSRFLPEVHYREEQWGAGKGHLGVVGFQLQFCCPRWVLKECLTHAHVKGIKVTLQVEHLAQPQLQGHINKCSVPLHCSWKKTMALSPSLGMLSLHLKYLYLTTEHRLNHVQFLHMLFKHNPRRLVFKSWRD